MFSHPLFETTEVLVTRAEHAKRSKITARSMAKNMYSTACIATVGDVALARQMEAPLVTNVGTATPFVRRPTKSATINDVALSLQLPILEGVKTERILKFREENRPQYEQFRAALTVAIREAIARLETGDPRLIADSVRREYVVPALAEIQAGLATAKRAFSIKAGSTASVGGALVTVGLLSGMPVIFGTGVATVASASLSFHKFLDDRRQVELSDMYFLWKASRKATHH